MEGSYTHKNLKLEQTGNFAALNHINHHNIDQVSQETIYTTAKADNQNSDN